MDHRNAPFRSVIYLSIKGQLCTWGQLLAGSQENSKEQLAEVVGYARKAISLSALVARMTGMTPQINPDPTQGAAAEAVAKLLNAIGEYCYPEAAAIYLRVPEEEILERFEAGELLGLEVKDHPPILVWAQFFEGEVVHGVREVLAELAYVFSERTQAVVWLASPSGYRDGRSYLQLLREDKTTEVLRAARRERQVAEWVASIVPEEAA